jgi:hypothetical protein
MRRAQRRWRENGRYCMRTTVIAKSPTIRTRWHNYAYYKTGVLQFREYRSWGKRLSAQRSDRQWMQRLRGKRLAVKPTIRVAGVATAVGAVEDSARGSETQTSGVVVVLERPAFGQAWLGCAEESSR